MLIMAELSLFSICDVYPKHDILALELSETVSSSIKKLSDFNVYSAPVINKKRDIVGLVDLLDLVDFSVKISDTLNKYGDDTFESFIEHNERLSLSKISEVLGYVSLKKFDIIQNTSNMSDAIHKMSRSNIKRLLVMNNRELESIITESSIINFIWDHKYLFSRILNHQVSSYHHFFRPLVAIDDSSYVVDAFRDMRNNSVSALVIVDEHGNISGTLSVKDLRTIVMGLTFVQRLCLPIKDFMKKIKRETDAPRSPIVCSKDEKIEDVIEKMVENKIHRVWITENSKPTGIVSLKDILELVGRVS